MGRPGHAPSDRRRLVRQAKAGGDATKLLADARTIRAPGHRAIAIADVALHARAKGTWWREVDAALGEEERPAKVAEVIGELAQVAARLVEGKRGKEAAEIRKVAWGRLRALPAGSWVSEAIGAASRHTPPEQLQLLMDSALTNKGFEVDDAKQVLRAWFDQEPKTARIATERLLDAGLPSAARARIAAYGALRCTEAKLEHANLMTAAVAHLSDVAQADVRSELWRLLALQAPDRHWAEDLEPRLADEQDAAVRCQARTTLAARADKLGAADLVARILAQARADLSQIEEPTVRAKVARKVALTAERAGLEPGDEVEVATSDTGRTRPKTSDPAQATAGSSVAREQNATASHRARDSVAAEPELRHALALVNTYRGGLSAPHLRAVSRAGPLCAAFGLDLVLVDFPSDDVQQLVDLARRETKIGHQGRTLDALASDGRVRLASSFEPWFDQHYCVATTSSPAPDRTAPLDVLAQRAKGRPLMLVMGVGPQGLPRSVLGAADAEYEITGAGIELETAVAMGVLADRLGACPPPARVVTQPARSDS